MTGQRRAALSAAGAAALVLTIAAAGPAPADGGLGSLSAQQISRRAHDALFAVQSLHLTIRKSPDASGTSASMDLTLDRAANCRGSVGLGKQGSIEIVKRGNTVWIKPDQAFWKQRAPGGAAAKHFAGRYLKGSAKQDPLRQMAQVCDLNAFLKSTGDRPGAAPVELTKGKETRIHGVSVIPVRGVAGSRTETLYVATHGKPYPIQLSVRDHSAHSTVRFADFDKPVPPKTPPPNRTIDLRAPGQQPAPVGAKY